MVRARVFKHIQHVLPKKLFDQSLANLSVSSYSQCNFSWRQLQSASVSGTDWGGIALNLSKAYNTLPRRILQTSTVAWVWMVFGCPTQTFYKFSRWTSETYGVQNHWGQGIKSRTGIPESCPYAVVQMILLTWVFTATIKHELGIALHSFVDDWVVADGDYGKVARAAKMVQKLANDFGLFLSLSKSAAFASSSKGAGILSEVLTSQGLSIPVVANFEGLGVQFHACGTFRTSARNARLDKATCLLKRLQSLPWKVEQKTAIVKRGILPLALYGCETQASTKTVLGQLRAKANHAVWSGKQYHDHFLTPLFSGNNYEPLLYILQRRFPANTCACELCGSFDDTVHRFRNCPGTGDLRQAHGEAFLQTLPDAVLLCGLFPQLDAVETYAEELDALPSQEILKLDDDGQLRIFFTDGAGSDLGHPATRFCAWAVTEAAENSKISCVKLPCFMGGNRLYIERSSRQSSPQSRWQTGQ